MMNMYLVHDINVMSGVGTIKVVTDGMYWDINTTEKY